MCVLCGRLCDTVSVVVPRSSINYYILYMSIGICMRTCQHCSYCVLCIMLATADDKHSALVTERDACAASCVAHMMIVVVVVVTGAEGDAMLLMMMACLRAGLQTACTSVNR